jgi:type VI protein secretion system component Hcp
MSTAADLFLKLLNPNLVLIKGDSRAGGFWNQIEIDSWDWKLAHRENTEQAEPSVLGFSKLMDNATTTMLTHMAAGDKLSAEIALIDLSDLSSSGGKFDGTQYQLTVHLKGVRIIRYSFEIESAEGDTESEIKENWTFDYDTVEFRFSPGGRRGQKLVKLTRPTGASKETPGGLLEKVRRLASGGLRDGELQVGQLEKLFEALKKEAEELAKAGAAAKAQKADKAGKANKTGQG